MENRKILTVGSKAYFHKTISESDVYQFAGLTGDYSRIHMDKEFAKTTRFGQQIAHGLISSSFISTIMGMQLPGSGTIFLDQYVEFKNPVFFGDTITAEVELIKVEEKEKVYIGEFKGTCTNQRGEAAVIATAHQMMPKTHFIVEQTKS
ncbi:MAG: MaoC family dehydratase [Desulfovibrio sp.]|jgi:acyl dehydratase|nr:MaoC family dehydratase [Desulfovibrio sp.]